MRLQARRVEQLRHVQQIMHTANDLRTPHYTADSSGSSDAGKTDYGKIPRIIFYVSRLRGGAGKGVKSRSD